jgi:hypothetical protein
MKKIRTLKLGKKKGVLIKKKVYLGFFTFNNNGKGLRIF